MTGRRELRGLAQVCCCAAVAVPHAHNLCSLITASFIFQRRYEYPVSSHRSEWLETRLRPMMRSNLWWILRSEFGFGVATSVVCG